MYVYTHTHAHTRTHTRINTRTHLIPYVCLGNIALCIERVCFLH